MGIFEQIKRKKDENTAEMQVEEEGETIATDASEMVEQEEVEVTAVEEVAEVVPVPKPEEKDSIDLPNAVLEDTQQIETELVDLFFDPSKKYYSDVKLNILEHRLETLLQTKKQLLNHPNPDDKKLEEIVLCIQTIRSEIDYAKYESCRFSSEA